jgi:hypothetical protein
MIPECMARTFLVSTYANPLVLCVPGAANIILSTEHTCFFYIYFYTLLSSPCSTDLFLGIKNARYLLGMATNDVGSELPVTGWQSTSSCFLISKLAISRMKTRYSSRLASRDPAQMRYPTPYVKRGASGCSNQRSGRKSSGSDQTPESSTCQLLFVDWFLEISIVGSNHIPILQAHAFKNATVPLGITVFSYVTSLIVTLGKARRNTV